MNSLYNAFVLKWKTDNVKNGFTMQMLGKKSCVSTTPDYFSKTIWTGKEKKISYCLSKNSLSIDSKFQEVVNCFNFKKTSNLTMNFHNNEFTQQYICF